MPGYRTHVETRAGAWRGEGCHQHRGEMMDLVMGNASPGIDRMLDRYHGYGTQSDIGYKTLIVDAWRPIAE